MAGYLFGIARHLALRRLSASGAWAPAEEWSREDQTAEPAQETVLDSLTRTETIEAVRAAVRPLPPQYREVIVLCELQEMEYAAAPESAAGAAGLRPVDARRNEVRGRVRHLQGDVSLRAGRFPISTETAASVPAAHR